MKATVSKWGNSLALRLPRHIADGARLSEGTSVDFRIEKKRLVVVPSRPKYRLADLLENEGKARIHAETDWGPARGKEAW